MTITMNTIGTQYDFQVTDGKNLGTEVEGMEWIRISEKKIGKGKGKTVAAISVPSIDTGYALFNDALAGARREMLTMMYRAGKEVVSIDEVSEQAVHSWYLAQSFSVDAIGNWFSTEMQEYLTMNICTTKGWNSEALDGEQEKYVSTKCAAYKAAFLECGSKFPKLSPEQKAELFRVIALNELSGGIVDRIVSKLEVKVVLVEEALGFN